MVNINKDKVVNHWLMGSKETLKLARAVYARKYYDHALFCGHLALEKLLKAIVVDKIGCHAPRTHDLLYLAGIAKFDLDIEQQKLLTTVTTFNIEGRYPEDKLEFHKRATRNFSKEWLKKIEEIYKWLLKRHEKN